MSDKPKIYKTPFKDIYPMYVAKVERKGGSKADVNKIIYWLCGYNELSLAQCLADRVSMEDFFVLAPQINANINLIKGSICGYKVEEVKEDIMHKIRCLDKLIDELSKGKAMDKILRT